MVKMVIAVRKDITMGKGKLAAQVAHAAVACTLISMKRNKKIFDEWYAAGQKKVVVKVDNVEEIYRIKEECKIMGVVSEIIMDAGFTQLIPGTITCIGIGPDEDGLMDQITGKYKLL
ncbi:MAG: peptidyl-tRNA hydrolase Pth2 [Ferroplasma sp.]